MGLYIHTTSDTSAGALTPIMDPAGVDDGYVASPCIDCPNQRKDKNLCIGKPGCRIRSYREPVSCADGGKKDERQICSFPGCDLKCKIKEYCKRHYFLVFNRIERGWKTKDLHKPVDHIQGNSKVTEDQVRVMRKSYPEMTYREIGEKYGISPETARAIVRRKTWKHIKD